MSLILPHKGRLSSKKPIELVGYTSLGVSAPANAAAFTIDLTSLSGGSDTQPREGDLVVLLAGCSTYLDQTFTYPGTWTKETELYSNGTYDCNLAIGYKIMTSSPDTSVAVTLSTFGNNSRACALLAYVLRNVNQSTPIDVTTTTSTGSGNTNPPSITPSTAGSWILACGGQSEYRTNTFSSMPGLSSTHEVFQDWFGTSSILLGVGYVEWTSGAVDPSAWASTYTDRYSAATLAIRPS